MVQSLSIADYTAKGFIETLATILGLPHEIEEREHCVSFNRVHGQGYIKAYDFDNGIAVYEFDCTTEKKIRMVFQKDIVQPLVLLFNREHAIQHKFKDEPVSEINRLESLMVCSGSAKENVLLLPEGNPTCFFALLIDRKKFEKKIEDYLASIDPPLEKIFRDVNGINSFYIQQHYSLDISKFIEEFVSCEQTGFMRHVFLEGKTYEILTHFFKQYLDDQGGEGNRKILRQNTVEKIEEAVNIIEEELESLGSIMSIAKRVGLNQNTLQEGFQQLFKKSVNQYIKDIRLEKAKDLIENTDLNITEITYRLGINSRSYFSKLFKERYGMTPKGYVALRRKGLNSNLTG